MPESPSSPAVLSRKALLALLAIPALAAVVFTLYTGEVWEDFFITFRHTENLVKGNGLVYQVGERVHGFTSVLNTLLPALPLKVFGTLGAALNFYRVCSLAVLLAGLYLLWRSLGRRLGSGILEIGLIAVLVATSVKIIVFTMNGQEEGFLVGFFAMAIGLALRFDEPKAWRSMGLVWAGLLYTRPDSPVYIAVAIGIAWAMRDGSARSFISSVLWATALATVCYAPWLIWAWSYYGSPIPHTIIAKAGNGLLVNDNTVATFEAIWDQFIDICGDVFGPVYGIGGWPTWMNWGALLGALGTAFLWLAPLKDRFLRASSLALMVVLIYMAFLRVQRDAFPWYFGPSSLLSILVIARFATIARAAADRRLSYAGVAFAAMAVVTSFSFFVLSNRSLKIQQLEVEEHTRKAIGLWLHDHAKPGDTVYVECMGYIGYYSGLKILDYPGLVAPEVVKARHEKNLDYASLPEALKPTWIVARRPGEFELLKTVPENLASYDFVNEFKSTAAIEAYGHFSGEHTALHDAWFAVLHRKPGI